MLSSLEKLLYKKRVLYKLLFFFTWFWFWLLLLPNVCYLLHCGFLLLLLLLFRLLVCSFVFDISLSVCICSFSHSIEFLLSAVDELCLYVYNFHMTDESMWICVCNLFFLEVSVLIWMVFYGGKFRSLS